MLHRFYAKTYAMVPVKVQISRSDFLAFKKLPDYCFPDYLSEIRYLKSDI